MGGFFMRYYGGKKIRSRIRQMQDERIETRDGILYDVDYSARLARVLIQGSDKYVYARWPENWEKTPVWLKPGNCVRITHPAGNKGRIELAGHGLLLPTTSSGGDITPPVAPAGDGILSGAAVTPTLPTPTMAVLVATGTIRIDGVTYTLNSGIRMGSGMVMGTAFRMGSFSSILTIDAASATLFRYDLIVAGTDGQAEVVKGTEAASNPTMPATPADHVKLQHVLVHPGMTEVEASDIGAYYTDPVASVLSAVFANGTLHGYSIDNPHFDSGTTLTIRVKDQYGNVIGKASPGYALTIEYLRGNGDLSYGGATFDEGAGPQTFYSTGGEISFTYARQATLATGNVYTKNGEASPMFLVTTTTLFTLEGSSGMLSLLDDFDAVQL